MGKRVVRYVGLKGLGSRGQVMMCHVIYVCWVSSNMSLTLCTGGQHAWIISMVPVPVVSANEDPRQ